MVKKLPGAESMLMVYDLRDRLAATQDGVQRAKSPKEWLYTKYDELNRPILTGTIQSANTRVQMQTALNAYTGTNLYETRTTSSTHHYYTQNSFPNSDFTKTYLAVSYYDDYDINNDGSGSGDPAYTTDTDFPNNAAFSRLKNKVTVSKARELDPASSSEVWFTTASFFDKQYRVIQTKTTGIQGGSNLVTNEVNFPGWLLKSKETQTVVQGSTSLTNTVLTRNDYDHQGRLLNTYHKINSGTEKTLSSLSYNELGQLLTRKLHVTSGTGLQKLDYTYNIRGWLKKINEPDLSGSDGDFFGMELLYNEDFTALNGTNQWNGNISGMKFKNSSSGVQKGYGYTYDQLNRLTAAKYGQGSSFTTNVDRYNENMTYDRNGNILTLSRKGQTASGVFGNLDILTYSYTGMGNQVRAVGDAVTDVQGRGDFYDSTDGNSNKEYYYDRNGNMWLDRNKKMKVVYNILNLPAQVIDTVTTSDKTEYVYTSSGVKLKQRLSAGTTLLYNGSFVYELDGTANGIIVKYILTAEGRANYLPGAYTYEYFMKDHLGNIRINFKDSSNVAVIIQQSDYYPFGMIHQPQATTTSDNRYLFNGKELQNNLLDSVNLDLYDYGARFYDPQIGRWNVVDPSAERDHAYSPYCYAANNPVRYIDPDGRWFDDKNLRKANRVEKRETRQISKLEKQRDKLSAQGKDIGDLNDRIGQLHQSVADVRWMKSDTKVEYKYASANSKNNPSGPGSPTTAITGTDQSTGAANQITMFVGDADNQVHESRHGGDVARGTLQFNATGGYGVSHEISAYRAQYSWNGQLQYRDQPDQAVMLQRMMIGQNPTIGKITNINQITGNVVNSMVDPGFVPIYPPRNANGVLIIPLNIWNSH